MSYKTEEIKKGIKLHYINTNKFKTNLVAIFITTPLSRETITLNSLIPAVLKRGTNNLKTQEEISIKLENMYGGELGCGIEKTGDNHVLKFYLEVLNDAFLPTQENLLKQAINLIIDLVFNPLVENEHFKENYVSSEKENLKRIIEAKIDNKDSYALNRCIEEMYKNQVYGLYKYGYVEDLEKIDATNLYEYYKKLIREAKIDIFISGEIKEQEICDTIKENKQIKELDERLDAHIINDGKTINEIGKETIEVIEKKDVTQGKLVIGLDVNYNEENAKYAIALYNVILGESATSKLFQNVREKASLAYTARSNYIRQKGNIFIRCGIEIDNYEKAVDLIKQQLKDMKNGDFSEEDIKNAKAYMISGIRTVEDEQDSEITYYIGQELTGKLVTFKEYTEKIKSVTREEIENIAQNINISTIYFLRN